MFEDEIGSGVLGPDVVGVIEKDVHAPLVVGAPGPYVPQGVVLRQPLGEVKTVAVNVEFIQPEGQCTLPEITRPWIPMVEVEAQPVRVNLVLIVPRVT